jgi:putative ABC transport system permease protein
MNALETLRVAVGGIVANKMRSLLTILGMTIGVSSVIILIAVGKGSATEVSNSINRLGSNVLTLQASSGGFGPGASSSTGFSLTAKDVTALSSHFNAPDIKSVSPTVSVQSVTLVSGSTSYQPTSFIGTTPSYATAKDYQVTQGEMFTSAQVKAHEKVAVIGPTVVQNLFAGQDPIGQTMRANGVSFRVIGVTKSKGTNGFQDQDSVVLAPVTAVQDSLSGYGNYDSLTIQATGAGTLDAAQAEATSILNSTHDVTDTTDPGYSILNQSSIREASSSSTSVFTTLLGAVAAISLLVGGIGVMNIMLVSVTERTREIGIRKAIGARRADILGQFLTEAVLVSVFGGIAGVLVGIIGSQFEIAGVQPVIAPYSIFLAFGAAVLCGLFFGTYPASRASKMRPIDALRYE